MGWHESKWSVRIRDWMRRSRRARRYLAPVLVLIAAAALVGKDAATAALAIVSARRVAAAEESVIHTREVRETLYHAQRVFNAMESQQRGFLLTGETRHLEEYRANRVELEQYVRRIVELTADSPAQQRRIDTVRPLLAARLALLEEGVQLRVSEGLGVARSRPTVDEEERLMESVRAGVSAMIAAEDERLREREVSSTIAARNAVVTSLVGLVASVAVVFGAIWLLDRRAREVVRARKATVAVLRAVPDAVVWIEDQRVSSMNNAAEALFRRAGLARPTTLDEFVAIAKPPARLRDAMLGRQPLEGHGLDAAFPVESAGEIRRILPRTVPLATGDSADGVLVVLTDVTDLARLDEMRSDLVAAASHELRTPTTTLRMSLLMLREGAGELAPRMRDLIDTALVGVQQLLETVDELLDMTRIEAGQMRLSPEPLYLQEVVREAADRSRARADELGLQLQVRVLGSQRAVLGDRARLRIVVDNLVRNALKYTPVGGTIELTVSSPGSALSGGVVELAVTDSGRGVPEEFRSRVFEKFFRVEHYRPGGEREPRGAGIGLYLCKEIVGLHGGTIRCEAAPTGRGSRFVIALPAAESSPRDSTVAGEEQSAPH
jgi:signal transduction histidine kinase